MIRGVILVLTCVQLSLVKGLDSNPVESKNENGTTEGRRILFGTPANPQNYPFMVRLRLGPAGGHCGGSIISNHWIMTASHCTRPAPCDGIEIFPGVWPSSQSVYAAECFYHEQYRTGTFEYDISLLRVDPDILADGRAQKVSLPLPGKRYPPGTPATLVGWGQTEAGEYPYTLLNADVLLEKWSTCNVKMKINYPPCNGNPDCPIKDIPIRVVCTQGQGPAPPSNCFGDSGGPLIVDGQAVGVFSFLLKNQEDFCAAGAPSMFTSVVDYLPWIFRHVDPSVDTSEFPVLPEHILD